ncbi:MAG: WcaF family extracellular polysaccharide biosynthesis acetyltransferase [Leptolyngbya sp. BL-A-14]
MHLHLYSPSSYSPGAPYWKQLLWYFLGAPFVKSSWLPISSLKVFILRFFGAQIGQGVRIKPGVSIKFPWRLVVGDHVWIGENAWIDNLALVHLESNVCLSQKVYLCTGNHDWSDPAFQLKIAPIHIKEGSWIAAGAIVGPGVTVEQGAVLTLGGVALRSLSAMTIYTGNPAQPVKARVLRVHQTKPSEQMEMLHAIASTSQYSPPCNESTG